MVFFVVVFCLYIVAPYTGAWIEIQNTSNDYCNSFVAPYTGAWIEMSKVVQVL